LFDRLPAVFAVIYRKLSAGKRAQPQKSWCFDARRSKKYSENNSEPPLVTFHAEIGM
jgi:hypothetical protein